MIALLSATAIRAATTAAQISPFGPLNTGILGVVTTLLVILINNQRQNRKMTIQVNGEMRAETIEEMTTLRGEIRDMRRENTDLRIEVQGLRSENQELRDEVRGLHSTLDAMRQANRSTQDLVAGAIRREDEAAIVSAVAILDTMPNAGGKA